MSAHSVEAIQAWMVSQISEALYVDQDEIDINEPFSYYGLSSRHAATLSGDLGLWLDVSLSPTLLYEYPTIKALSNFLSGTNAVSSQPETTPAPVVREPGGESEPIAIIGMSCRFPGANDPQAFWQLMREGRDAIREVPAERWDLQTFYDPDSTAPGKMNTRWGGFLDSVDRFDSHTFGISPREAERMDPQQRLLMEVAWEALEDAGIALEHVRGTQAGVFIGISNNDYCRLQMSDARLVDAYAGTGNSGSIAANRLSYFFDLRGPSITIDSACSSGLVAVHLACQSLRHGESNVAMVGAANVILSPEYTIIFAKAGLLAPDGRCKVFDASADGYVRSEGAGVVVLKPLSAAVADGDHIYAVILGSAVNQDGRTNGLTSPSRQAQEAMLLEAYRRAGVSPGQVQYVEAHGTGTELGDPIEAKALGAVLALDRPAGQPCAVGSIKSNIGHTEAAAGIAGLIKVALSLQHREIPPSIHFSRPNPHIPFDQLPIKIQQKLEAWPGAAADALAGVSAFGFGGTNAHVVLTAAPATTPVASTRPTHLLTLSAKTPAALDAATAHLAAHLKSHPELNLADVAYTLQTGRSSFSHRRVVIGGSTSEAASILEKSEPGKVYSNYREANQRPVAFMLGGVGDHYRDMARGLYETEASFRAVVDECCELLRPTLKLDLRTLIFNPESSTTTSTATGNGIDLRRMLRRDTADSSAESVESDLLQQTRYAQPAVFVVEYALSQLLISWGIRPSALIGYSLGEYVCATLAGVFRLEDALTLVAQRAELIEGVERGAMLAVALPEVAVRELLGEGLSIAIINSPQLCVVAGTEAAISAFEARLAEKEVVSRRLPTTHAFHSGMMLPIKAEYERMVEAVERNAPQIAYVSNVTGDWVTAEEAVSAGYWARHLCEAVRFGEGVEKLLAERERVLVEVGAGQTLSSIVKQQERYRREMEEGGERVVVSTLRYEYERERDEEFLLTGVGKLWLAGVEIEWRGYYEGERRQRVELPTYPFERQRYWIETETVSTPANRLLVSTEAKAKIEDWFYAPRWNREELPSPAEEGKRSPEKRCWLLFLDESGVGAHLSKALKDGGHDVVTVRSGTEFGKDATGIYSINARERADYDALLKELQGAGLMPDQVAHLWNVGPRDVDARARLSLDESLARSFYSLLFLAQAVGERGSSAALNLAVISTNLHRVSGDEVLSPEKATVLGPCKVISQEYENITCRSIDLVLPPEGADAAERLAHQLVAELSQGSAQTVVAWRGAERWVQTFEPVRPEPTAAGRGSRLRQGGVYLITGGLGGVGLGIATDLGQSLRAKLVLTGRTALPSRSSWDALLAKSDAGGRSVETIRKIRALEEAGAEVLIVEADVSCLEEMRKVVELALARFGAINGVIHAAGVPGEGLMQLKTPEMAARVLAPKVNGTLVLETVLRNVELDFLALFSSIAAVVGGGPGQVDYCAANAFLDAYAQANPRRHGVTISIDWAEWQWNAWHKGLLGFNAEMQSYLSENRRKYGLDFDEGAEALRRILDSTETQVVVSTRSLASWVEEGKVFTAARALESFANTRSDQPTHARPVLGTAYAAVSNEIERKIADIWQRNLGIANLGIHDKFFDLGGTSLIGMQVIAELKKAFDVELPSVALYEAPTISTLAKYLNPAQTSAGVQAGSAKKRAQTPAAGAASSAIAIIGMSGRFPGAASVNHLWSNLVEGAESIIFFSNEELMEAGVDPSVLSDARYVKAGGVLTDIDMFDAALFGYSPREAEVMDPQHRLFLECAWEALEIAGYDSEHYDGSVGVFGGSNISTYLLGLHADAELYKSLNPLQTALGNANDSLTTKVSYKLNLRGPSIAIQTFCSTSAVAIHVACQNLLMGSCDMALAGGVRVAVPHRVGYFYETGGIDSPDGHCRAFDAKGQGAVLGNGVAIVVLKRLEEAVADGDQIYAVIKGSAINNDGSLKVGYTAPSVEGQSHVVSQALENAGVEADSISYIEAHGTGTELGDPIEFAALTKAFRQGTPAKNFCAVGSVKTNLGHLDRAAGATSLIKTALSLKHKVMPPSLHFSEPSPKIDFENSPFFVNTALREWKRNGTPRRAGVNALGIGGTNVHFILEEAPELEPSGASRPYQLLTLSAHTSTALDTATTNLVEFLRHHATANLADVAYTLQVGRRVLGHKSTLVCHDINDAITALESRDPRRLYSHYQEPTNRPVAFMLGGVGDHYRDMARGLYETEASFRAIVDECCELLRPTLKLDLRTLIFNPESATTNTTATGNGIDMRRMLGRANSPDAAETSAEADLLQQTRYAQPAVFVVEYALSQLLMSWGIRPSALIGYSLGEYVCATLAGVFRLEDALSLVARRAELIEGVERGAMLAVAMSEGDVRELLGEGLWVAVVNSPQLCVVAGREAEVAALEAVLAEKEVVSRRLPTTHAFHSGLMEPIRAEYERMVEGVERSAPQVAYVSNVTGDWVNAEEATSAQYWGRHMCEAVRFGEGVEKLLAERERVLVEVGAGQTLSSIVKQQAGYRKEMEEGGERIVVSTLRYEYEQERDEEFLLRSVGKLWLAGMEVSWAGYYEGERRLRVELPTYPFERQRYWIETRAGVQTAHESAAVGKKAEIAEWFYEGVWREREIAATAGGAAEVSAGVPAASGAANGESWLILEDEGGIGEELGRRLRESGAGVVSVKAGEQFAQLSRDAYVLKPGAAADYEKLLKELKDAETVPDRIVHLWNVTPTGNQPFESSSSPGVYDLFLFDEAQSRGFYSLINLAKALGTLRITTPLQLDVVSTNLQAVNGQEELSPEKATLLGPCKVIPQEYPNVTCRSIDLSLTEAGTDDEGRVIEQLLAELTSGSTDLNVCYRAQKRYVESFEPARLEAVASDEERLREGGVYLITGGMGGVGFALADALARGVHARLILTGRSALPEREEWDGWLARHDVDERTSRKIRKVQALEELGAEVLVASADVADEGQMRDVLARATARFGKLDGVIHAAGIVSPDSLRAIQQADRQVCERHFQPKIHGLYVLDKLLRGQDLDFCYLFSSLSSVLGGIGFVAYAASNIFMDSFARRENQLRDTRWISVNWDTWNVRDEEEARQVKEKNLESTVAEFAMTPEEGVEAFRRTLSTNRATHLVHSTGSLESRLDQWIRRTDLREQKQTRSGGRPATLYARPNLRNAYVPVNSEMERRIAEVYQKVLGIEDVGLHDNFFDLGGTSLTAIQVVSELQKVIDAPISPITLFEAPTVRELTKLLAPAPNKEGKADSLKQRVRHRQEARQGASRGTIAIVGMTGRFPGARNVDELWRNLRDGVESISIFTDEELQKSGIDPAVYSRPNYVRARPIIEDTEMFDASFFGYSPREAEFMDPQHRLFMECAWDAMENAGYDSLKYNGSIGVFAGANISSYGISLLADPEIAANFVTLEGVIAHDKDSLTTSVSYKLNLKGPSFAVQTFCSTSLVAVHLAMQSLRDGECDMALAGGVSVRVPQKFGYLFEPGGQDSRDGHTRAFDAQAGGTIFGDGVGIVVLKRLDDALADGDLIHAVIKGSAINNDGSLKVGYTAPSVEGQAEVVAVALANAGVDAKTINYVEAHGSATELGDPIEVTALSRAFRVTTDAKNYCALGSVKTNVGHLDRAAGVTGLIKTTMALKNRVIPPSLHFEQPNPNIDFENSPFFVNTALREWKRNGTPRRAGVNALGVGGTNVHLVLEEAPAVEPSGASRPWQALMLSARTEPALETATANLLAYLNEHPDVNLADVASTLHLGRRDFNHRRVVLCQQVEDAVAALQGSHANRVYSYYQETNQRPVAFMLGGVGDHYRDMARGLYETEASYRATVDECCELLQPIIKLDLRTLIFNGDCSTASATTATGGGIDLRRMLRRDSADSSAESVESDLLQQTRYAQPAVFVVEYALSQLLISWGIRPSALIGYSLGEYVCATLAGVFRLEDALTLVARRSELIEGVERGAMLAVAMSEGDVRELLGEGLSIAIINSPQLCVVAGREAEIAALEAVLAEKEVVSRRLPTTHAFHSGMMLPIKAEYERMVEAVERSAPQIAYVSNVTGDWVTAEEAVSAGYWARHLCETVRFGEGVEKLLAERERVLVEVGAGQTLSSIVKQQAGYRKEMEEGAERVVVSTLRYEYERERDEEFLLRSVGKLWLAGVELSWAGYYEGERRHRVELPTYPFERQRYWIEPKKRAVGEAKRPTSQEEMERIPNLADWFYVPVWRQSLPFVAETVTGEARRESCWLVLIDETSLASRIVDQLRARGEEVVTVAVGDEFTAINDHAFAIDPRQRGDYDLLLKELESLGKSPERIVHLWNVAPDDTVSPALQVTADTLALGFYALMFLTQALGDSGAEAARITYISSGMHRVIGDEKIFPAKATLLGHSIVIPCEYTNITCRGVDVVVPEAGSRQEMSLVAQLLQELDHTCKDIIVAYRHGQRWEQGFEPLPLAPVADPASGSSPAGATLPATPLPRLRERGVYLITGGTGGIGLAVAEHLARSVRARLVLTGRTALPPRGDWDALIEGADPSSPVVQKIWQVRGLEESGAEVLVLAADVSDVEQMRRVVEEAETRFGTLDGVFHAAGVPGAGLIQLKTAEVAAGVLAPKVAGTVVLDEVLGERALDFIVLFSSMTSIVGGGPGQLDYCAANAFLDAYAQEHNGAGGRAVVAINWGEWQWDAWQAGLLGFDTKIAAYFKENRQKFGVSFAEGLDALGRVMATRLAQVVVSTRDFKALIELSKEFTVAGILHEADKGGQAGASYPRPTLGTSYVAPSTEAERSVAAIWQDLLRIEQVGINDNFFELGGNSLLGINLIGMMKKRLKAEMPMYALYEAPTVKAMASFITAGQTDEPSLDERHTRGELRRQKQRQRRESNREVLPVR